MSSNYTFVAHRPQYGDDSRLQHYLHVVVDKLSAKNVELDGRRLDAFSRSLVSETDGRLVSATVRVSEGSHRLYTVDGRPLTGYVYGYGDRSTYASSLASVTDAGDLWWTPEYLTQAETTSTTQQRSSTVTDSPTAAVTTTATPLSAYLTTVVDDVAMTPEVTSRDPRSGSRDSSVGLTTHRRHAVAVTSPLVLPNATSSTVSQPHQQTGDEMMHRHTSAGLNQQRSDEARLATSARPSTSLTGELYLMSSSSADVGSSVVDMTSGVATTSADDTSTSRSDTDYLSVDIDTVYSSDRPTDMADNTTQTHTHAQRGSDVTVTSATTINERASRSSTADVTAVPAWSTVGRTVSGSSPATVSSELLHVVKDDEDADGFELFKLVFIYGGLSVFCSLLVAWFFCSQTTLRKRRVRVSAATTNDGDESNVTGSFSSTDRSVTLGKFIVTRLDTDIRATRLYRMHDMGK